MLMRRQVYQAIGTHEAVRGSLIEDMDMARRVKSLGMSLRVAPSASLFTVRMYSSREQIVRGWQRIFVGAIRNMVGLSKVLMVLVGRGLVPLAAAAVGWAMVAAGAGPNDWWRAAAILGSVSLAAQLVMTARFYAHLKSKWQYGLTYPIACLMVSVILVQTMLKLRPGGKIVWRDTVYNLAKHTVEK